METAQAVSAIIAAFAGGFGIGFVVGKRDKAPVAAMDNEICPEVAEHFPDNPNKWFRITVIDRGCCFPKSVYCEALQKKRCTLTGRKCRFL